MGLGQDWKALHNTSGSRFRDEVQVVSVTANCEPDSIVRSDRSVARARDLNGPWSFPEILSAFAPDTKIAATL